MNNYLVVIAISLFLQSSCFALINGESIPAESKIPLVRIEFENDSPVMTSLNQVIGISWGTLLSSSSQWNWPNLNFITDLRVSKNLEFLKRNMGKLGAE